MFCTGKSAAMSGIWGLLIANDIFNPKITGLRTMSKGWILRQEIWKLWAGVGTNLGSGRKRQELIENEMGNKIPEKKSMSLAAFQLLRPFFGLAKWVGSEFWDGSQHSLKGSSIVGGALKRMLCMRRLALSQSVSFRFWRAMFGESPKFLKTNSGAREHWSTQGYIIILRRSQKPFQKPQIDSMALRSNHADSIVMVWVHISSCVWATSLACRDS